jgi:hypothetical protein
VVQPDVAGPQDGWRLHDLGEGVVEEEEVLVLPQVWMVAPTQTWFRIDCGWV